MHVESFNALAAALAGSREAAESFTCDEADAIARGLALNGHRSTAVMWLSRHALGDEEDDDAHVGLRRIVQSSEREAGAARYLDALVGQAPDVQSEPSCMYCGQPVTIDGPWGEVTTRGGNPDCWDAPRRACYTCDGAGCVECDQDGTALGLHDAVRPGGGTYRGGDEAAHDASRSSGSNSDT